MGSSQPVPAEANAQPSTLSEVSRAYETIRELRREVEELRNAQAGPSHSAPPRSSRHRPVFYAPPFSGTLGDHRRAWFDKHRFSKGSTADYVEAGRQHRRELQWRLARLHHQMQSDEVLACNLSNQIEHLLEDFGLDEGEEETGEFAGE